ncbi:hypothetical protein AB1L42_04060 [Thalassoglobus sp. JC818]|uniref:hypothetical protein n=1 Tax=Thalassoglobus sp. JC818 TaxID=3232136 RepID=UPI00345A7643
MIVTEGSFVSVKMLKLRPVPFKLVSSGQFEKGFAVVGIWFSSLHLWPTRRQQINDRNRLM